jgi:hypothetical protein
MPMTGKDRYSKRRLATSVAVALVLAGGAVAAVTAVGQGTSKHGRHARAGIVGARDLAAAATYLGVAPAQLAGELRGGKSLAQIADATPGKSSSGLVSALVSAKRKRLDTLGATVTRRVSAEVNRSGLGSVRTGRHHRAAAGFGQFASGSGRLASVAAGYLGLTPAQLQQQLRSGRTLAEVANGTPGKSESGLVGALVAARRESISAAVGARRVSLTRAKAIEARLVRRFTAIVNRSLSRG